MLPNNTNPDSGLKNRKPNNETICITKRKPIGSSETPETKSAQNHVENSHLSLWERFLASDVKYTLKCSVCSSAEASYGKFRPVMKLLEMSCHGIPWLVGTVLLMAMSHKENDVEFFVNLLLALIFDLLVIAILKGISRRSRPPCNKMDMFATVSVDQFSFPSGHTTRAAMVAAFILTKLPLTVVMSCVLVWWSVIVACSRVCLGRHHISDVVCGYIVGLMQFYVFITYLWLPSKSCLQLLEPFHGHFHL